MAKRITINNLEDAHFNLLADLETLVENLIRKSTPKEIFLKGIRTTELIRVTKIRYDKEQDMMMLTTIEGKEYWMGNLEFDGFMFIEMAKQIKATLN